MMRYSERGWIIASVVLCVLVVIGWQAVCDANLVSRAFLSSPERTWLALTSGLLHGKMSLDLLATVERMLIGWALASVAGVALGALIGLSMQARAFLGPTLEFLRPLPASAVVPVGIAFLGLTQAMVLCVICFGTVWPMLLASVQGFARVEPRLLEVGKLLRLGRWSTLLNIALPSALPEIMAGTRLSLTVALILSVVGEMLAGQAGLGLSILLSARAFRAPDLYAGVVLLGAVGFVSNAMLGQVERRLLRWTPAYMNRR